MISKLEIRESRHSDAIGIEQLYVDAFPDEDLLPLVRELLDLRQSVISLVDRHAQLTPFGVQS